MSDNETVTIKQSTIVSQQESQYQHQHNHQNVNQSSINKQTLIDPVLYNALQDTNEALKEEISRLIPIEKKYYDLEKKV